MTARTTQIIMGLTEAPNEDVIWAGLFLRGRCICQMEGVEQILIHDDFHGGYVLVVDLIVKGVRL